jgi:hypothetical protein
MRVEKKKWEINPKNRDIIISCETFDIFVDIFTGEGKEQIDEIIEQNTITDILLAKFLQENPTYRVVDLTHQHEDKGE